MRSYPNDVHKNNRQYCTNKHRLGALPVAVRLILSRLVSSPRLVTCLFPSPFPFLQTTETKYGWAAPRSRSVASKARRRLRHHRRGGAGAHWLHHQRGHGRRRSWALWPRRHGRSSGHGRGMVTHISAPTLICTCCHMSLQYSSCLFF